MPRIKQQEVKQPAPLRVYPSEREYIEAKYSSLSNAIRLLAKGGKYEQLINENDLLTTKLREIQG